ncbi:MAG: flagellar assembly protein FliW [Planctomycetota bacterium]|jgi:flagellar assembly factor FliW
MKVLTSRFGEIEVDDATLISFPEGVVGFKESTRFVIFDCGDEGVFEWLQSVDNPEVAFVICEAQMIKPDYRVMIGKKEMGELEAESLDELLTCLILCIPEDPTKMTANLLGPIVFNTEKRLGMQLVLMNPDYSTRYPVFQEAPEEDAPEAAEGGGAC